MVSFLFLYPKFLFLLLIVPLFVVIYFFGILYNKKRAIVFANFQAMERIYDIEIFSKNFLIHSMLYIMTLYLFILPIMMVEGPNIANTISRTITLAHRNFWSNIGWVAVFLIILIVVSVIFSGIILLPFTGNFVKTIMNPEDASTLVDMTTNPLFIILSTVVSAITLPLMPIFSCILYFNGKAGEEQGKTDSLLNRENEKVRVEDLYAKPYTDDHPENPKNKG